MDAKAFDTSRPPGRHQTRAELTRRRFVQGTAAVAALAASGCQTAGSPETMAAARAIIEKYPTIDMHSHAGRVFSSKGDLNDTKRAMAEAGLTVFFFSPIADAAVLKRAGGTLRAVRQPAPGELYSNIYRQLRRAKLHFELHDLIEIHRPADIQNAKTGGRHGVLIAIEGGDFLEGRPERVEEAYGHGVRSVQLVHYRINELGDIQTESPKHGGLTPFGRDVVREQNRLGMIVDVAHLTFAGVKQVAKVTTKPIILSHGMLGDGGGRSITSGHAKVIAGTGGVIGLFSAGERNLGGYINRFRRLADVVGAEHVGIGSDMDSGGPFYVFKSYRELPALAAGLLDSGFNAAETAGILGGNFLRVFRAVSG